MILQAPRGLGEADKRQEGERGKGGWEGERIPLANHLANFKASDLWGEEEGRGSFSPPSPRRALTPASSGLLTDLCLLVKRTLRNRLG